MSLKKGQKVVCVTDKHKFITKGKVYEVISSGAMYCILRNDVGVRTMYLVDFLKPISSVVIKDKDYEDLFV
jgi:hypothetical protein